jgi:hypothetical protein
MIRDTPARARRTGTSADMRENPRLAVYWHGYWHPGKILLPVGIDVPSLPDPEPSDTSVPTGRLDGQPLVPRLRTLNESN